MGIMLHVDSSGVYRQVVITAAATKNLFHTRKPVS
jgi:hypothetical protein